MTPQDLVRWLSLCSFMSPAIFAQQTALTQNHPQVRVPLSQARLAFPESPRLNLNTATREQLLSLPGIGPRRAQAILDFRQIRPFQRVSQLGRIKGLGPKQLARLKDLVTVAPISQP